MKCSYCDGAFGSAKDHYNEDRRVETSKGPVHMRCLAYLVIDLGVERAFGSLGWRDRQILDARLLLPTVESDRKANVKRYRKVHPTALATGSYAPEVTNRIKVLMDRVQKRSRRVAQEAQLIAEAKDCIKRTSEILETLN